MGEKSSHRRSKSRSPRGHRSRRHDRSSSRDRKRRDDRSRDRSPRRDEKRRKHSSRHSRSRSRSRSRKRSSKSDTKHTSLVKTETKKKTEALEDAPSVTKERYEKKLEMPSVPVQPKESVKGSLGDIFNLPSASKESVKGKISDIFRVDESSSTNKSLSKSSISLPSVLGGRQAPRVVDMDVDASPPPTTFKKPPPPPPPQPLATPHEEPVQSTSVNAQPNPLPHPVVARPPPPPRPVSLPKNSSEPVAAPSVPEKITAPDKSTVSRQEVPQAPVDSPAQELPSKPQAPVNPLTSILPPKPTAPVAVDVGSIKMDILKALAQAKSSLASGGAKPIPVVMQSVPVKEAADHPEKEEEGEESVLELRKSKAKSNDENKSFSAVQEASKPISVAAKTADGKDYDMFALDDDDDDDNGDNIGATGQPSYRPIVPLDGHGNQDDSEGYYKASIGEVLNGEYRVVGTMGKGVFSTVLMCKTTIDGEEKTVAVKLIRNNDTMRDAAQLEVRLLHELQGTRKSKYVIRLLQSFEYRNHAAMVFEPMQMNVREAMKKFGGRDGLALRGVKVFARQLLLALDHLEKCNIVHADIKPDNMLLDEKQSMVKLCDFGSAFKMGTGEVHDPTPYLVSRYYRAPEVILGLSYDQAVDMWSLGCCLYEMFTGKVMFPGQTNNEMLKLMMELKGRFPPKLVRRHRQVYLEKFLMEPHFDDGIRFCSREIDRVTGTPIVRTLNNINATRDLTAALMAAKSPSDDKKMVLDLKDLLDKIFHIDPSKRISVTDALKHPFARV
ncbi:Serine/threonine-protein kinase PRP4 [Aphanomyces cochlioides]|nr:Serine/threonine-protein kinase PRP4 [Aphanomyces cochlioides]